MPEPAQGLLLRCPRGGREPSSPREVARSAGLAQAGSAESRGRRASPLTTLRGVSQVLERGHSRLRPLHVFLGVRDVQVLGGGVFWGFCCWLKKNTTRSDLPEDGQLPSRPRTPPEGKSRAPKQRFAASHRPGAPEKSAAPTENRFPREKTPLYKYQFQQKASCCPLWPQRTDDAVQSQRRDALRESRSGPAKGSSVASRCRQLPLSSPEPGASCHVAGGGRHSGGDGGRRGRTGSDVEHTELAARVPARRGSPGNRSCSRRSHFYVMGLIKRNAEQVSAKSGTSYRRGEEVKPNFHKNRMLITNSFWKA